MFLIASCQEKKSIMINCEERINHFNYPSDIELLESENYVCDSLIFNNFKIEYQQNDLKMYEGFKIIFSDKNYCLAEYDLRTRLLYDRKENLWLVFKAGEVGNFYFNKPGYKNLYGLGNIYVLDKNLIPLYSFNKLGLRKYRLNDEKKITESLDIELKNTKISHNIDLINYNEILKITNELKSNNYIEKGNFRNEYFYKNPPVWCDL